ncbi:MAG TPA: tetratricopeptide repeat protein [Steroidobacteraceae bacterium]|nr:tetratricopeptide repeat protein [Steroidobacteraceae bacterium]
MHSYGVNEVARMLQLSRATIRSLISRGFVAPARGPRREYRFSFQDLLILRTARALVQAKVPARRIGRSLLALRKQLPKSMPLTGLTICAVGNDVVVRKGGNRWQAESGQYLLELDVSVAGDAVEITQIEPGAGAKGKKGAAARAVKAAAQAAEREAEQAAKRDVVADVQRDAVADAQAWFERGLAAEDDDPDRALEAYERCRALDVSHVGARINLGRLYHEAGRFAEAHRVYREAARAGEPDATLFFNMGVLLEDTSRREEAVDAYLQALAADPDFADAHFNLARLYEALGQPQHAIRHLGVYRRLLNS